MGKSVQYTIDIISGEANKQRIDSLRSSVGELHRDLERASDGFGDRFTAQVAQAEAAMARLRSGSFAPVGPSSGRGSSLVEIERSIPSAGNPQPRLQPTVPQQQQFGPSTPPAPTPAPVPQPAPQIPNFDEQLDGLKKLKDELGNTSTGLDDVAARAQAFQKRLADLDAESAKLSGGMGASFREMVGSVGSAADGIGKLAGGIAFLGVGNENAEKLVKTLMSIKGTVDVFTGLSQTVTSAAQVFSLFKERTDASARSAELLGERKRHVTTNARELIKSIQDELASSTRSGKAHEAQAQALRSLVAELQQAADATDRLDASQDRLNRNRPNDGPSGPHGPSGSSQAPRGRRGRGGRGILGAAAGMLGYAGANFVSDQIGDSSGIVDGGLDMAMDNAGSIRNFMGRNAGRIGGAARIGGAVASAAALGKIGYDVAAGGGTIDPNSMSGKFFGGIGENRTLGKVDQFLGLDTAGSRLADSFDALERAQKRYAEAIDVQGDPQRQLTNDLAMLDRNADQTKRDARFETNARARAGAVQSGDMSALQAATGNAGDVQQSLNKELATIAEYEARLENLGSLAGSAAQQESRALSAMQGIYQDAVGQADVLRKKMVDTQQQVISGIKEEAATRRQINQESINAAQSRLSLIEKERDMFKTNEQRLQDAAVKFAKLSDGDKFETIQAQKVAQSGGTLDRRQRELLENLNLGAENDMVRKMDLQDAKKSGFFDAGFGSFERQQMQGSMGRADQLNDIQRQAEQIGAYGDPRQREAQLRELNRAQEGIGLQQQAASRQTASGPSAGERRLDAQAQQVRAEVQVRQDFNVRLGLDETALIAGITRNINAQMAAIEKRINDGVNDKLTKDKAARTAEANKNNIVKRG